MDGVRNFFDNFNYRIFNSLRCFSWQKREQCAFALIITLVTSLINSLTEKLDST
jgi:hypothetical protein